MAKVTNLATILSAIDLENQP